VAKISRAQAEANRAKVVETAAGLFRERGFEGVSVGELMAAAGFTHGGFYNHFGSKEALAAEAVGAAWASMAAERARAADFPQLLDAYLSRAARGAPAKSCPAAALAGEVARGPEPVRVAFADGLEAMIAEVEAGLGGESPGRRERAVAVVSAMVGALMLSRAVPDEAPLAAELLQATRRTVKSTLL
jgi:TetR/AcrR family transcriptional repressor of nem operon